MMKYAILTVLIDVKINVFDINLYVQLMRLWRIEKARSLGEE